MFTKMKPQNVYKNETPQNKKEGSKGNVVSFKGGFKREPLVPFIKLAPQQNYNYHTTTASEVSPHTTL